MSNTDWRTKLEEVGALWLFNYDNPQGAHALLTSGKHSDGYCNCAKIAEDPALVTEVAAALIEKLQPTLEGGAPDYVVGPAYGAITFAHEVARQLGTKFAFTEIEYTDEGKMQVLKRFDIPEGATALVIEDVRSTGGSALKTINVLEAAGITVLPTVGFIVKWNEGDTIGDKKIVALVEATMNIWDEDDCELCKMGSQAVRPKAHWNELAR